MVVSLEPVALLKKEGEEEESAHAEEKRED
jgi:hypothetical protein